MEYINSCYIYSQNAFKITVENKSDITPETLRDKKIIVIYYNSQFPVDELPDTVEYLTICGNYSCTIKKFPKNLKFLEITQGNIECALDNLPDGLEALQISMATLKYPLNKLPATLKYLYIFGNIILPLENLPLGLEVFEYNNPSTDIDVLTLPPGLKYLIFDNVFGYPFEEHCRIDNLPLGLEKLVLEASFNHSLDNLPNNLKYLKFGYFHIFQQKINKLPLSLQEIEFDGRDYKYINELKLLCQQQNVKLIITDTNNKNN